MKEMVTRCLFGGRGGASQVRLKRPKRVRPYITSTLVRGFNNSRLLVVYHYFPHSV